MHNQLKRYKIKQYINHRFIGSCRANYASNAMTREYIKTKQNTVRTSIKMSQYALKLKPLRARLNDSILKKSMSTDNSFQIFTIRWLKKYLWT